MMDRLTEYEIIAGHVHAIPKVTDMDAVVAKLAHYEDLEEAGREVYVAVVGNYALNNRIFALSSLDLAEKFRNHMWKEGCDECINIFKVKIDDVVLKEEDL